MEALVITNWDENFENNRTRGMKVMQWVPVPNKHDGTGYTELMDHENGMSHLGAWLTILQYASKCPVRGVLIDDRGRLVDSKSIARVTRGNRQIIDEAIPRLLDIGWLTLVDTEDLQTTQPSENKALTPKRQVGAGRAQATDYRREGNGIEWNGNAQARDSKKINAVLKRCRAAARNRWSISQWVSNATLDRLIQYGNGWQAEFDSCERKHGEVTREWIDASERDRSISYQDIPRSVESLEKALEKALEKSA